MPKKKSGKAESTYAVLDPTQEEIRIAKDMLKPYYLNNPDKITDGEDLESKIDGIIERAKIGYKYCPKTFMGRIKAIAGLNVGLANVNWGKKQNYHNVREAKIEEALNEKQEELYPGISAQELRKALPKDERRRWIERESYYRKEFDLNNASDLPLLLQVLTEEMIQYRLILKKLTDQNANLDKQMSESYTRLNKALENLGITRRQRQLLTQETEGSIAKLAEILEAKKKKLDAIREKDLQEERAMTELRKDPSVLEKIPAELREITSKAMTMEDWD